MSVSYIRLRERCRAVANRYGACSAIVVGGGGLPLEVVAREPSTELGRVELEETRALLIEPALFGKLYDAGHADLCTPCGALWTCVVSIPNRGILALVFDDRDGLPDDATHQLGVDAVHLAALFEEMATTSHA